MSVFLSCSSFFFFFQAEDGIRDVAVPGVQTCALPISGWMASKPTWIPTKQIIPLIQSGIEKEPALPDVPLITKQAVRPGDQPLLDFMGRAATVGRPLATTPGVPAERVAVLRRAFQDTIRDPEFIAAARQENMEIRPQTGEQLQGIIFGLLNSPQDVRER